MSLLHIISMWDLYDIVLESVTPESLISDTIGIKNI